VFELLFLIAIVAWIFFSALEFVLTLPCAPTIIAAAVFVPLLTVWRWHALMRAHGLSRLHPRTRPVPPERFYWPACRRVLGWRFAIALVAAILAWPPACLWPAGPGTDPSSLAGWVSGPVAILATAETLASGWLYLRASHWFDRHAPRFVGLARRALYRLSDNHEFLGEEALPREKRHRAKVY
jgi:hypothetical protein